MAKLLWMTIDRHPESLRSLIRQHLAGTGWDVHEVSYDSIDELDNVPLEHIDAVLLAPARYFPASQMTRLHRCKLMQIWSSGFDKFNIEDAHHQGLAVANNHGSNAVSVAEHAILMMLGISRRVPEMHQRVVTGEWSGNDHGMTSYSLAGKTLGLVGLGNIGKLVAHRAEGLGMKITFADPGVKSSPVTSWRKVTFEELLAHSDYISFHVHLGAETANMIGQHNIDLIQNNPFVINVSRAELFERETLIQALDAGRIRGVAIDAHYDEPTNPRDPLFGRPNVLFSPHVAGSTVDSYADTVQACIHNVENALTGAPISGRLAPPVS